MKRNTISESASISSSEGHKNKTNSKHKSDTYRGGGEGGQKTKKHKSKYKRQQKRCFRTYSGLNNGSL